MRRALQIRLYAFRCALAQAVMPRDLRTVTWKVWVEMWAIETRLLEEMLDEIRAERALGIARREKAERN